MDDGGVQWHQTKGLEEEYEQKRINSESSRGACESARADGKREERQQQSIFQKIGL